MRNILGKWIYLCTGYPRAKDFCAQIALQDKYDLPRMGENRGEDACDVMAQLYSRAARKGVSIKHITGSFMPCAYERDGIVKSLEECIRKKLSIDVIVTDREYEDNNIEFVEKMRSYSLSNPELCTIRNAYDADLPHMVILGDLQTYRIENNDATASANFDFNDPEKSMFLGKEFDYIISAIKTGVTPKMSYAPLSI